MKKERNRSKAITAEEKRAVSRSGPVVVPAHFVLPKDYPPFLEDLKKRIYQARIQAALSVNQELLLLHYDIGLDLHTRTQNGSWGSAMIDRLAQDLQRAFPGMAGFSPRNLRRMRSFYKAYPLDSQALTIWPRAVAKLDLVNWPRAVAKLPWGHNALLIEKCKDRPEREWYAQAALDHGWSRDVLSLQIDSGLYQRKGNAVTNFHLSLPAPQSDLAQQAVKDPYYFDFLGLSEEFQEKDLQAGLIQHISEFLVELSVGFAYMGSRVHLAVGEQDYYVDLLFYHVRLRCHVIIELKEGEFRPEYAGKMNFYLSAADDLLRHPDDKPSIGLILCRSKDRFTAEYALRDIHKPIGVAEWSVKLVESLPNDLRATLPSVDQLEEELNKRAGRR